MRGGSPQLQSQVQRLEQEQQQMLLQVKTQEAQMRAVVERLQVLERLQVTPLGGMDHGTVMARVHVEFGQVRKSHQP